MYQGAFLARQSPNVRDRVSLTRSPTIARALNILGVEAMTRRRRGLRPVRLIARAWGAHGRHLGSHQTANGRKRRQFLPPAPRATQCYKSRSFRTV